MSKRSIYSIVATLGLVGFGVLMAVRTEPSSFAARIVVAALAGICLGVALLYFGKARSSHPPKSADG
jgi:hypothetical protein